MDELLQKYINGEIDYDTYTKLKKPAEKKIDNSGFSDFARMMQKENYEARPNTGDLSKSIFMDDEELDTYSSRGITPTYGSDYQDTRAEYQGWDEQLGNGLLKFAGKTGTAVAGGLGMIPGLFYGAATGSLTNIYDNAFQRALDDANKAMDEALPNYVTNEERENNVLQSMGTMNFWANDFLGGASFVTGAILTELATAGLASPIVGLKAASYLKNLSYGSKLDDVAGLASKFNNYNTALNVGKFGRQMLTGAGYEAGVEARGFIDEAKEQWINEFIETRGREPMEEELALAMNDIRSVANGVFGTNLALVSASNIITLPKYFGPGISKKLGVNAGEEANKKWVKSADELTEAELKTAAKNTGKTVEQLKADKWVNKFDTFNKYEKAAYYAKEALEKPITEGLVEEGMQSFINKTALDYIDSKYEGYNIDAPTDLVESMSKAFSETYGGNDSEFWKEVVIGGLLGGIGGIKLKGGLGYDIKNPKSPEVQKLIAEASQRGMTKETIQSAIRQANITAKQDAAIETGDMFDAKNKEDQSQFDYVATKIKLGRFDEIESEITKQIEQMTPEEFGEEAGYTNMTKQELATRKQKVVSEFMENAKNIRESFEQASRVTNGMDPDVAEGLGFVLYMGKRIDSREDAASELLSEKLGKVYNNRVMKTMAKFIEFQNEKASKKIEKYNTKIEELENLTKEELEANKNRTSSEIMARGKKIESLEKEISQLEKELEMDYHSFLKERGYERKGKSLEYDRDTISFKEKLNDFITKQKELEEKNGKDIFKRPDVDSLIKDVNKLAAFREQQITTANYFFTEKGLNTLQSQIAGLKKLYEEDRVNAELAAAQAMFLSKKQEYDRMTDVATLAYKLSASRVGIPVSENAVEPKIEALNKLADTLEDSPEKDYFKQAIEKVKQKLNNKDVSNIQKDLDTIFTDLFNKIDNEKYKDLLTLVRQTFDNIINYLKGTEAESVLETYERMFKIYVPKEMDSEKWLAKNNIDTDDVTLEFRELSPEDPIVKDALAKNRISFALEAKTEKPILQDFIGIQRLIQVDGKYYSVVVKIEDKEFGFMLDPNRYKFRQADGSYRDFNPESLSDLRLLNPAFVLENGTITDEGERFVNMYKRGIEKFKLITDAISKGAKKMYSGELKEHFFINKKNQFKEVETKDNFNIVEEITSKPEVYNIVPQDSPEGIEVSRDKFLKTSFLVYTIGGDSTYYYYNPETNTFEELVNSKGRAQLQKYLKIKDDNQRDLRTGLSLISHSKAGPIYTTVRIPQMEETVSDSIIREMVTNIAEGKQPPKLNYLIYADNIKDVSLNIDFILTKDGRLVLILKDSINETEQWINVTGNAEETGKFSPGTIENLLKIFTKKILAHGSKIGNKYPEFKITGVNKLTYKDVKDEIPNIATNATVTLVITQGLVISPKVKKEDSDFEFISRKKGKSKKSSFEEYDEKNPSDSKNYADINTEFSDDDLPSELDIDKEKIEEYGGSATNKDFDTDEDTSDNKNKKENDTNEPSFDPDDPDSIGFKIESEEVDYQESIESRINNLKQILPSWIPVEDLKTISSKLNNNGFTYGAFMSGIIYLTNNAPKGVEYHEAFHAIFRTMLNNAQIAKAYSEARIKYGKPTAKQLSTLKGMSPLYSNLNNDELEKLWLEEQMADDFQKFMLKPVEPKSFLQRLFDRILKFLNWAKGNTDYLNELFYEIQSGKFINANKIPNTPYLFQKPAFKAITFEEQYEGGKRKRVLSGSLSNTLLNNIKGVALRMSMRKLVTSYDIKQIIETFKNDLFTEEYQRIRYGEKFDNPGVKNTIMRNIKQLQNALSNQDNINYITEYIKSELNALAFHDYTLTEDEDGSSDVPTEFMAKETAEQGGFEGLTKEFKKYLSLIPVITDEFGLGIDIKDTSGYISFADPYQLYNHVVRILSNRKPSDMLSAFYSQSTVGKNNKLRYLRNKLFNDIALELGKKDLTPKEIAELPITELSRSTTFNMFVANFRKNNLNFISITPDVEQNKVKVFRSNINDVKDVQYNEWANNSLVKPLPIQDRKEILSNLANNFRPKGLAENVRTIAELNEMVYDVQENLNKLGIVLSEQFIKLSIYKNHPNTQDLMILDSDNSESYGELNKLLKIYNDLSYLNSQLFTNLNLSDSESLFTVGEEKSIGELKKIAEANSYFDFDIIPTVFKNIEGKTIYSYIQPNYITDIINLFKENSNSIYEMLVTDYDTGLRNFKEFLSINNLSSNDFIEEEYFKALRFNPILTSTSATDFLNNLEISMLDGLRVIEMDAGFNELTYKRLDDGKTFQSLDPRAKLLTYFYLYGDPGERGNSINAMGKKVNNEEKYVPFIPFQNEGKNTQYAFLMPKRENLVGNKLNNEAKELLHKVFEGEFDTLKRYFSAIANKQSIDKVKGVTEFKNKELYNRLSQALKDKNIEEVLDIYKNHYAPLTKDIPSLPRMIKFSNIEVLFKQGLLDNFITKAVNQENLSLEDTSELSEALMNDVLKETLELLVDNNIITKTTDNDYTNVMLPQNMLDNKTDIYVDINKIKNFLVDDYINSVSSLNMLVGNLSFNFKDAIDLPKRMAGLNASGPSLGTGQSNVSIIEDIFKQLPGKEAKQSTDGQSYATQTWYENKYLKTFKKWNPKIQDIYKKIRKTQKLSWEEKQFLENFGALTNSRKISIFGYSLYGKTSVNPISRNEVSFVEKKNQKVVNELVDKLYETVNPKEYQSILKQLHTYYKPYPHTKKMHYLLNSMENSEVDLALSESAVKTIIYNTQKFDYSSFDKNEDYSQLSSFKISDTFVREQVVTDNMKTKIVDGTQLLQLIDSEQEANTDVTINISGKDIDMKVEDVIKVFKNTKAYRITQKYNELKQSYYENGKPRYKAILKSFRESLEQMGSDPIIREMLSESENLDNPKYNLNLTRTLFQVEKMLYAYLGEVFSQKVSGQKFTLLTDDAYKVIEDSSGKIITMEEFRNNPNQNYTERDLEIFYDSKSKTYVAEVVISAQTAYRYGLKPGSEIEIKNKKLLEYIGTRIPTQDKSSMVVMRVVDYLPVEKGNTVILPFETMFFSGADFDIDSLFAQTFATYEDNNKEIIYGDYLSETDKDVRLEKAYKEFRNYYSNVKSVKADYDRFLSLDKNYNTKLEEREYTEKVRQLALVQDLDDMLAFIREHYADVDKGRNSQEAEQDIKDFYKAVQHTGEKALLTTLNYVRQNYTKEVSKEQLDTAISIEKSIKEIKELNLNRALLRNNYPNTLEDFKEKYTKQVEDNYNAVNKGTFSSYKPLTKYETDNFMFELKKVLIRNEGNKNSSLRDVERGPAETLTDKLKQLGIKDPTEVNHYLSLASKAKMSIANATGGENIGVAALGNVMAQYLINAKTEVVDYGTIKEFDFNGSKFINEILSLWITLGVDNAKHQDAGRFSINKSVQGALVFDTMLNQGNQSYSVEHILSLGLTPSVKQMVAELESINTSFKTKKEKQQSLSKSEILKKYKRDIPNKKWEQYTIDEIYENIKELQENPDNKSLDDFKKAATYKLSNLMYLADYSLPFTQLLSIIKGNKPSSAENLQIIDALDSIGLQMTSNGLQHTPRYYFEISEDPSSHPIDFLKVIESNVFLETEIELFHKMILEDVGMFLIPMSKDGLELISDIRNNLKNSASTDSKLSNLIKTVVNSMGFYAQRNIYKKTGKQELPAETYLTDTEDDTFFLRDFKTLKSFEGLQDNFFLKNLAEKKVQGKDGSPISNKWVQGIQTNFRLNMTPDMKKRMSDDAFSLFAGEVYNKDGSLNTELSKVAKRFTVTLVNQLWQVDAGLFLNQSILPYLEPFFLTGNSAALDEVQQAIAGNKSYQEVFGISKKQLFKEIKTNFLRDYNNLIDVRGNSLIYVKKNIKSAIKRSEYFQGFLQKYEHTTDSELKPLIEKLKSLTEESKDNKVNFSEIDELSPVKINDDGTMELVLVPSMFDVKSKEARELLKTIYRQALATTGLTNVSYKKTQNNRYILFHEFLDTLIISVPKKKEGDDLDNAGQDIGSERIIYELVEKTEYEGYPLKATYRKVPAFGSKLHKHYYRTPEENNKIYSSNSVKPIVKQDQLSKGENISSKGSDFAKKLTNPGNSLEVIYKGKLFRNAEHAYQTWKSGEFDQIAFESTAFKPVGSKPVNKTSNFETMVEILEAKLTQHPDLIKGINERGGLSYIQNSTHNVTGDKFWESSGQNKFIKALEQAYTNLQSKKQPETNVKNDNFTKGFVETMSSFGPSGLEKSKEFLNKYETMYDLLDRLNTIKFLPQIVNKAEENLSFSEEGSDTNNTETFIKFAKDFMNNQGLELMKKCKL